MSEKEFINNLLNRTDIGDEHTLLKSYYMLTSFQLSTSYLKKATITLYKWLLFHKTEKMTEEIKSNSIKLSTNNESIEIIFNDLFMCVNQIKETDKYDKRTILTTPDGLEMSYEFLEISKENNETITKRVSIKRDVKNKCLLRESWSNGIDNTINYYLVKGFNPDNISLYETSEDMSFSKSINKEVKYDKITNIKKQLPDLIKFILDNNSSNMYEILIHTDIDEMLTRSKKVL